MAIFGPKPWVNPLGEISIFSTFWTSCFYSVQRRFYVRECYKRHFPGLNCLKKKVGKMAISGLKPCVNPFGTIAIFSTFCTSCFYSLRKHFYVLEYHKRHFPGLYCLKNKVGKIAIFRPKPWVPFGKMSIFRLFELLLFIA